MLLLDKSAAEINKLTDEELVKLTLENQDIFLYLMDRYKQKLSNYIRRITNANQEDIEDTLQEVFIKVYLNLNDFNDDLKFSSWIYRITHNQVISNHRKLKARPEGYAVDIDDQAAKNLAADIDIIGSIDIQIVKRNIFKILDKLDEKYREILILKFLEEKNYQEISDILKKPMGTVASLLNKAKQEFRLELKKQNIKF
ncbi:MAG: RNA polymerase sigma factor [Patescibacteria group bacterium]|jgi:RNA polymerase sigma-70 factor (ECF subfamily)